MDAADHASASRWQDIRQGADSRDLETGGARLRAMAEREFRVFVHEEDDAYWAEVESLPGCFASGGSLDELREAVVEAITLYLSSAEPDGAEGPSTFVGPCRRDARARVGLIQRFVARKHSVTYGSVRPSGPAVSSYRRPTDSRIGSRSAVGSFAQ